MFEQELYNAEPVEKSQEGDLFHDYEIKNWEIGPRIYKILAISAVFNLVALGFVAQSDLLTRRGCESPWVGRVCQVLDLAYVGTKLFGTERDYVDAEYERIDLGDSEITFIDVSGETPPLSYPEGYFQIANPEEHAQRLAEQQNAMNGFNPTLTNPTLGNDLLASAPKLPAPNPNAVIGTTPDKPWDFGDNTKAKVSGVKNRRKNNPTINTPSNTNTDQTVAQNDTNSNTNTDLKSDPVKDVEINKRPMVDLGNAINELNANTPLDLQSEFVVNGKGRLDKNGRFDPKTFRYGVTAGKDEAVVNVVKNSIEAINEAGYLAHIKDIVGKELSFTFQQGVENIEASFQTDLANDSLAKQRESSLDFLISLAKKRKQAENASQDDKDDLVLLEGIQTEVVGKTLVIKFVIPKAIAHPMIQRKLAEQAAANQKPSGQTSVSRADTSAKR